MVPGAVMRRQSHICLPANGRGGTVFLESGLAYAEVFSVGRSEGKGGVTQCVIRLTWYGARKGTIAGYGMLVDYELTAARRSARKRVAGFNHWLQLFF